MTFTKEQLIEDLKASSQNATGMFEIHEGTICSLMSLLTTPQPLTTSERAELENYRNDVPEDYFASLVTAARIRADKAMLKFPQPNYVLNKVAEESGEVIKAVIHFTEGREQWENVEAELIDNLAMLIRLVKEGDQVIGFTPPEACRAALLQGAEPVRQPLVFFDGDISPEDAEKIIARLREMNSRPGSQQVMITEPVSQHPELTVWYGSMPETNGKANWTAILHRKGECLSTGITIEISEYPDRVRYEADRVRHIIGELKEEPDILAYDADAHSGYVKPGNSPVIPDGWVACSERLPEGMVDVITSNGVDIGKGWWDGDNWKEWDKHDAVPGKITHWMPLPAAPQQEVK